MQLHSVYSQGVTNTRVKSFVADNDTIVLDSLSIVSGSDIIFVSNQILDDSKYEIDYTKGLFILNDQSFKGREIKVAYRVFPMSFEKNYEHKTIASVEKKGKTSKNPFLYEYTPKSEDVFYLNGLNKSGSISRGVVFGNNQDLAVNSSLNLQLSGKISEEVSILASISDDNIPIQAEGNTQQLQEFDRVFVQLFNDSWKLTAGDFYIRRPKSYFMNFNKKVKGGSFEMKMKTSKKNEFNTMRPIISAQFLKENLQEIEFKGLKEIKGLID